MIDRDDLDACFEIILKANDLVEESFPVTVEGQQKRAQWEHCVRRAHLAMLRLYTEYQRNRLIFQSPSLDKITCGSIDNFSAHEKHLRHYHSAYTLIGER